MNNSSVQFYTIFLLQLLSTMFFLCQILQFSNMHIKEKLFAECRFENMKFVLYFLFIYFVFYKHERAEGSGGWKLWTCFTYWCSEDSNYFLCWQVIFFRDRNTESSLRPQPKDLWEKANNLSNICPWLVYNEQPVQFAVKRYVKDFWPPLLLIITLS